MFQKLIRIAVVAIAVMGIILWLNAAQAQTIHEITEFSHPESITIEPTSHRIFVSNLGKEMNPTAKDGDGFISEVSANETIVKQPLDNKVAILNLSLPSVSRNKESSKAINNDKIELPANFQYPNGIAQAEDGTLYVGSVTDGQILQITPNRNITTFFPGSEEVFAATSLRLDEERGVLWGASPDFLGVTNAEGEIVRRPHRVFALALDRGEVLRTIVMPDRGFGNDIALDNDGGVYITDSSNPRVYYLAPGTNQLETWIEDERWRSEPDLPGLAGIARNLDGTTIVGMFARGELFMITKDLAVEPIPLERPLENPDGMQFASDGFLLLTEAAVESGTGRLIRIDLLSDANPKPIETIASGLDTPVNLTVSGDEAWVSESRIRHRLLPGKETQIPDNFSIYRFDSIDIKKAK